MECPLFVDYTRECVREIKELPADTLGLCTTERYVDCPFYRSLNKIGPFCERIENCPVYNRFKTENFLAFVEMTRQYCLAPNNVNCRRFILKKSGEDVPPDLLPDGRSIQ